MAFSAKGSKAINKLTVSQCWACAHYRVGRTCAAFPLGIPNEVFSGKFDHSRPHPNDSGWRFAARPAPNTASRMAGANPKRSAAHQVKFERKQRPAA